MLIWEGPNDRTVGKWTGSEKGVHAAAWYSSVARTKSSMDDDEEEEKELR